MKKAAKTTVAANVDEYLQRCLPEVRTALKKVRTAIKKAAPQAEELISYQVPMYKHHGALVCFAAFPGHCSFFVVNKRILEEFKEELKPFKSTGTTIHFSPEKPLPVELIEKIVKMRVQENEMAAMVKTKKKSAATKTGAGKSAGAGKIR